MKIEVIQNKHCDYSAPPEVDDAFSPAILKGVRAFHQSMPDYAITPLRSLPARTSHYGISALWVKDESFRFGLNAFKVLGASYAIAKRFEKALLDVMPAQAGIFGVSEAMDLRLRGEDEDDADQFGAETELTFKVLLQQIKKLKTKPVFITATDGNHGRAVAYMAQQLGCVAHILMPQGASVARQQAVRNHGATVVVCDGNYDDAVREAAQQAQENDWHLIQDTAWENYETVPLHIMQGYSTLLNECFEQLNGEQPTHIFVQAGVGSLAAAMLGYICMWFGNHRPKFIVLEPDKADCFYQSVINNKRTTIGGALDTISAGLSCGEPNPVAWEMLHRYADAFIRCEDEITKEGMRILAAPLNGDASITSGESGAIGMGVVDALLSKSDYQEVAAALSLDSAAKILLISTEGDTDRENYQRIISRSY